MGHIEIYGTHMWKAIEEFPYGVCVVCLSVGCNLGGKGTR